MSSERSAVKPAPVPPVFFRIKPEFSARLDAVCQAHNKDRNQLARSALEDAVTRLEAKSAAIPPEVARQVAEALRLGIDVPTLLRRAVRSAA